MVPADSDRVPRAPPYSGTRPRPSLLRVREFHPLRRDFPDASTSIDDLRGLALQHPTVRKHPGLGSSPFARHYSGNRCFFLFLRVLRCFSSPRWPRDIITVTGLLPAGLPHSDTRGSFRVCQSPRSFAACRVLHRRRKPRHPPSALRFFPPVNHTRRRSPRRNSTARLRLVVLPS